MEPLQLDTLSVIPFVDDDCAFAFFPARGA